MNPMALYMGTSNAPNALEVLIVLRSCPYKRLFFLKAKFQVAPMVKTVGKRLQKS